jgi:hypothetical protein
MNKKNINSTYSTNNQKNIRDFIPDSEDMETNDIEIVQRQKKNQKKK